MEIAVITQFGLLNVFQKNVARLRGICAFVEVIPKDIVVAVGFFDELEEFLNHFLDWFEDTPNKTSVGGKTRAGCALPVFFLWLPVSFDLDFRRRGMFLF